MRRFKLRCFAIVQFLYLLFGFPVYAESVTFALVQLNDVYEMPPVHGGQYGGLARVQTLINQVRSEHEHTFTFLAGDLISPSAIGTAKVGGESLGGRQMIDVLNQMQWDYFTLGNHEWDNGREALIKRLGEADFKIVTSNVTDAITGKAFCNTVYSDVVEVENIRVGIAGVTLPALAKSWVSISDPEKAAIEAIKFLKDEEKADIIILITHQALSDDIEFAETLDDVDLIVGGHEHENHYARRGPRFVPVAKADANAKSAYVHVLSYDLNTKHLDIQSTLRIVDVALAEDVAIKAVVDGWIGKAFDAFRAEGIEPEEIVAVSTERLDGLESSVRTTHTRLTDIVAQSALAAFPGSDASLLNGGSIRIDDVLPPGIIRQYDLIRMFPFTGATYSQIEIPGSLIKRALEVSEQSIGAGGFLHHANIGRAEDGAYQINGHPLVDDVVYKLAVASFLVDDGDTGLEFLATDPRIKKTSATSVGVREALAKQLRRIYGVPSITSEGDEQDHPLPDDNRAANAIGFGPINLVDY